MSEASVISDDHWAAWNSFSTLRRTLDRALESRLQSEAGISAPDFEVLTTLRSAPSSLLRSRDLAAVMGWEKSRLAHQLRRMEARGLIERRECESDHRGTWVGLTDEGLAAITAALPDREAALRSIFFDVLDDDEKQALHTATVKMLAVIVPEACDAMQATPEQIAAR